MDQHIVEKIKQQINSNPIVLYMKGTPEAPQCGFSAQVLACLEDYDVDFAYVNILDHQDIRQTLKTFSNWPTFPQLYVNGELVGGCDIVTELHQKNELEALLKKVA